MTQHFAIAISVILFVLAFVAAAFVMWLLRDTRNVLVPGLATLAVFGIFIAAAACMFRWSRNAENFYHVTSGIVIDTEHDAELRGAEGARLPEAWRIEIQGPTGRTAWVDVSQDDYRKHPKWSRYP